MFQRSCIIIDPQKSKEFIKFMDSTAFEYATFKTISKIAIWIKKSIYISDNVEFEDENGKCNGSVYDIESIDENHDIYLNFDNRNHRLAGCKPDRGRK